MTADQARPMKSRRQAVRRAATRPASPGAVRSVPAAAAPQWREFGAIFGLQPLSAAAERSRPLTLAGIDSRPGRTEFARVMYEAADIVETFARSAAAGISFLMAAIMFLRGKGVDARRLGGLFMLSTGVYVLISGEALRVLFGPMLAPVSVVAVFGTVFFWWFAGALFDDDFEWRWWRFAPALVLPIVHYGHVAAPPGWVENLFWYAHIGINVVLYADVFRLAISDMSNDLVDPRRRFRLAIAISIAAFGIIIAGAETIERNYLLPDGLRMAHGFAIFVLNLFFGAWLLSPRNAVFGAGPAAPGGLSAERTRAANPDYARLADVMDAGAWREEGLTVAALAAKIGLAEHQLRKLINQELGFRNFAAFLNERRVEAAKEVLADPEAARKQILQIALDLGYGSIAPFNRAFKAATGSTPTAYRKAMLEEGSVETENL